MPHSSVPYAELATAWLGLQMAIKFFNNNRFWIAGDLSIVISWLLNLESKFISNPMLSDLKMCKETCFMCPFSYTLREVNQVADYMANQALYSDLEAWGLN